MNDHRNSIALAGPGMMILSAAIFGFFGFFYIQWNPVSPINNNYLWFVAMCEWTLKISAVAFAAAAGLTVVNKVAGNVVYSVVGLASAAMFVLIAVLDLMDSQHTIAAYAPFVLLLFAAWNGYGSFSSLRELWQVRQQFSFTAEPQR